MYMHLSASLGCHSKMPQTEWLKQQKFISHSSGGWEVQYQSLPAVHNETPLPGLQIASLLASCQRGRVLVSSSSYKNTNPIMGVLLLTSSKPNYQNALPPNTNTLGIKTSTYKFGGDTNIQSITAPNNRTSKYIKQKLTDLSGELVKFTVIGDFSIIFLEKWILIIKI